MAEFYTNLPPKDKDELHDLVELLVSLSNEDKEEKAEKEERLKKWYG